MGQAADGDGRVAYDHVTPVKPRFGLGLPAPAMGAADTRILTTLDLPRKVKPLRLIAAIEKERAGSLTAPPSLRLMVASHRIKGRWRRLPARSR